MCIRDRVGTGHVTNLTQGKAGPLPGPLRNVGFSGDGSEIWIGGGDVGLRPVSYTHLDVYKRQELIDAWLRHSGVSDGKVFRQVLKGGILQPAGMTPNVVWYAVKRCTGQAGIKNLAPHDMRRTCAPLCHGCGGELEQIQFLLGHASVQTTERYIGSKQKLQDAVNDRLGISVAADTA